MHSHHHAHARGHGRHGHHPDHHQGHHFGPLGGSRGGRHGFGRGDWRGSDEGRGGRRRRVFDSNELRLVLLKLIADQPRHGYELIRAIEDLTGGFYVPSPGVVYPTLTMLHEMGQIEEAASGGARKAFAVTAEGTALLAEKKEEVAALFARLAELATARERTDGGPIRRAMQNLRMVLISRLESGEARTETLHQVAAILDDAAQKIERL
jgi:DNA-binding PadR family transcriptional regulator